MLLGGSAVAFRVFERNGSQRPVLSESTVAVRGSLGFGEGASARWWAARKSC